MNNDEYERIKRELGWYTTSGDVLFFSVLGALLWLLVVLS